MNKTSYVIHIKLNEVTPNTMNLRSDSDKNNLEELATSIKAVGLINPITVREFNHSIFKYQIVSGERRFKAAEIAGLETIPAIVKDLDDNQTMEIIITENLQRKDPNPLDEAAGFNWLLNTGKYNIEAIADKIGKPVVYVTRRLKFIQLIDDVRDQFRSGAITIGHALEFARLNEKQQEKMIKWMEANKYSNPTAARLKEAIQKEFHLILKEAAFDIEDDLLLEDLPSKNKYCGVLSCKTCMKRTGFNTNLFDDISKDVCTDPECYETKLKAHIGKTISTYVEKEKPIVQYSHTETAEKPGVLTKKSDVVIVKRGEKKCEGVIDAIVTKVGPYHYDFDKQVGETIKICNDPKCKVHKRAKSSSAKNEAANDKQTEADQKKYAKDRFEKDVSDLAENKAVIHIIKKLKYPLDDLIINDMIENVIDQWDVIRYLVECKQIGADAATDFDLAKYLSKQSNLERMRLLAGYMLWQDNDLASKLYKKYKVDITKLKKEARTELKLQKKEQGKAVDMEIPENEEDED